MGSQGALRLRTSALDLSLQLVPIRLCSNQGLLEVRNAALQLANLRSVGGSNGDAVLAPAPQLCTFLLKLVTIRIRTTSCRDKLCTLPAKLFALRLQFVPPGVRALQRRAQIFDSSLQIGGLVLRPQRCGKNQRDCHVVELSCVLQSNGFRKFAFQALRTRCGVRLHGVGSRELLLQVCDVGPQGALLLQMLHSGRMRGVQQGLQFCNASLCSLRLSMKGLFHFGMSQLGGLHACLHILQLGPGSLSLHPALLCNQRVSQFPLPVRHIGAQCPALLSLPVRHIGAQCPALLSLLLGAHLGIDKGLL
mmetsp:Transcript_16534/g.57910  ORF Transcript_16534/g.57910 Transcript_16534/m.57910 type:complete len:306 (+) Transcript_16534:3767-4684(+)